MDKKSGEMQCVCTENYTLADCSAEKCSDSGLICHNDAICEKDEQDNYTCQCSGQWAGDDCSASKFSIAHDAFPSDYYHSSTMSAEFMLQRRLL